MVQSVIDERSQRREDAIKEVSGKWGGSQNLVGPILTVPYSVFWTDPEGHAHESVERLQVLPDTLKIDGRVKPEIRRRGIFEVVLYVLDLKVTGALPPVDLASLGVPPENVHWKEAELAIGINDTRGLKTQLSLGWDDSSIPFKPGPGTAGLFESGLHAPLPDIGKGKHTASFSLTLQGSQALNFASLGVETEVALASPWRHPSFVGAFLPDARNVSPNGFDALWRVSHYGRSYPQQWKSESPVVKTLPATIASSEFGVSFYQPADFYQQSTRSVKYAVLFVALTFLAFFLFEMFSDLRLHPLQYLLVGFALALFYLLLISISEHFGFGRAYLISALGVVALVGAYCSRILSKRMRAFGIAGLLAVLYGYLYILLRLEDYALLMGSLALFVVLAAVWAPEASAR